MPDDRIKNSFPNAWFEMAEAGRCHAVGAHTAAAFHCSRALEIGLRAMAVQLEVTFEFPIEQADQEQLIRSIESKITAMKDQKKSAEKDANVHFYSDAATHFRFFKDAWRVRLAHARATCDEPQALGIIEHAATFLGALATRLKEPVV